MAFDERSVCNAAAIEATTVKSGMFWERINMLVEFSVVPIGVGESLSAYVAECMEIVKSSGLDYRLHPMGTVIEGEFDEVMAVVSACHKRVSSMCPRVITNIEIDDRRGVTDAMSSKTESVASKLEKG